MFRPRSFVYAKHFIRVALYFKVNFIMLIGVPVVGILYSQREWFFQSPKINEVIPVFAAWFGYMISYWFLVNGSGTKLTISREESFLKMFSFISQGFMPIIFGDFVANVLILTVMFLLLLTFGSILFQVSFWVLSAILLLSFIAVSIPVYGYFCLISLFKLKVTSLQPILTISTAILIFLTTYNFDNEILGYFFTFINPVEFVYQVNLLLMNGFGIAYPKGLFIVPFWLIVLTSILYLLIGWVSVKRMTVQPIYKL